MSFQETKRVTVKLKCPNPLFEEWLINWKEQAIAKESKMQYNFNRALQSLRKYPLPLESGRDCKILKGFGDRLCKMLDEKLKDHRSTNRNSKITNNTQSIINKNTHKDVAQNCKKQIQPVSKKTVLGSTTKQYIPQFGSGGYAILITLYRQSLEPGYPGFLSKTQIIQLGKDLVNSSFTKPDAGSRYTAWSSMRTLLSKNLVSKASHPPKFSLTQEGEMLARKLYKNSNGNKNNNQCNEDGNMTELIFGSCINKQTFNSKDTLEELELNNLTKENKTENTNTAISNKCYDIDIPDEFTEELFRNSWISENNTFSRHTDIDNMICDDDEDSIKFEKHKNQNIYDGDKYIKSCNSASTIISGSTMALAANCTVPSEPKKKEGFIDSVKQLKSVEDSNVTDSVPVKQTSQKTLHKFSSASSIHSTQSVNDMTTKHNGITFKKFASSSSVTSTQSTVSEIDNFVMAPNSFDIILYVDNHETSGSSNGQYDEILVNLTKQGIKHEVKDLKVGDFIWICRDRITKKELVLPYIVERKRMDDLAHSIKDKRYYEQKFRLKRSGIENLIYLVESHGKNQHLGLPLQTLYQAASNTAIQEDFFIKFTDNARETVEYLISFSRILLKMFKAKTLASCAKEDIQPVDIKDDLVSLITFKEFNQSSIKNKRMKVTELFVKMLIQIKGISVERALAITQMYPTPNLLKKVYQENPGGKGEKLLSNIKYGKYQKSIGVVLSKIVYQAFNKTQY